MKECEEKKDTIKGNRRAWWRWDEECKERKELRKELRRRRNI